MRASEEAELLGIDDDQLGEFAYDYVEVRRDYLAWTPASTDPQKDEVNVPQQDRHGITQQKDMVMGKEPGEGSSQDSGEQHTGVGGDRHAVDYEKRQR